MYDRNQPPPQYAQCRCTCCGKTFKSETSFDNHRIGKIGIDRRCMTSAELKAVGVVPNAGGIWCRPRNTTPMPIVREISPVRAGNAIAGVAQ